MGQQRLGTGSLVLGLLSVSLTLGVWAYIFSRAPQGAFHDQGGMLITLILFPLTFLGWVVGGGGAITLGMARGGWRGRAKGGRLPTRGSSSGCWAC